MMDTPFYQTAMGRDFYERTMPALVRELARLNDLLAKLVEQRGEGPVGEDRGRETEKS
jgi:hypothetical protein